MTGGKGKGTAFMQCIHEGKESILYRLDTNSYGVPVIVKQAKTPSLLSQQDSCLANEYSLAKDSNFPGIRRALDFGMMQGKPALFLEYVDGRTLHEMFVSRRQGLAPMLTIAMEIAAALVELHKSNIIHKKLNSNNILVRSADRKPVLIDLSIAARVDTRKQHLEIPEQLEGDIAYIAPEQSGRINRFIDRRTDLYSVGVIFYEMFTGELPFKSKEKTALIHDHIARNPIDARRVNSEIPQQISDIIMKLLQKNQEERYQSAFGLLEDLKYCLDQYNVQGNIPAFPLGGNDFTGRLDVPKTIFGRKQELSILLETFDRVAGGKFERMLVSGAAGTGKTMLVTEFARRSAEKGSLFVSGRFDQYQRNIPYRALNRILASVVRIILALPVKKLSKLKQLLTTSVGSSSNLLVNALPNLEPLLGKHKLQQLPNVEDMHHELFRGLQSMARVLTSPKTPLVILIDDLQWADDASLNVLLQLFLKGDIPFCFLIAAYGDDLIAGSHGLTMFTETLSRSDTTGRIQIGNLEEEGLKALITKVTGGDDRTVQPLVELAHEKTGGNPLLVHGFLQSLYEKGLLIFDFGSKSWRWDNRQLLEENSLDDVVVSVTEKIESLEEPTKEIIMAAACMGTTFDVDSLAFVFDQSPESILNALWQAADRLFIRTPDGKPDFSVSPEEESVSPGDRFVFTHNRVRQAAYALLPKRKRREIHLKFGRFLLYRNDREKLSPEQLFMIVDHFNEGFSYIDTESERLQLAELNLAAGRNAKQATAYQAALWYLNMGIGFLPPDRWKNCYSLASSLFAEAIEAEYLNRNFSRVLLFSRELIQHARSRKDKIPGYRFQLLVHTAQKDSARALETSFEALETFGVLSAAELPARLAGAVERPSQVVDTSTIIKASHMLSEEIQLDQLLSKLIQLVMENAGAEKGVLIVLQDGQLLIRGRATVETDSVEIMQGTPVDSDSQVPFSVVNYVARTGGAVVLADASHQGGFMQDDYIRKHRTRSVLCLPIVHQSKITGLLYLENNLATDVFTSDRFELLQSLLTQAAISMENAKLYARLEEKVTELNQTSKALGISKNWLDRIINTISDPIFVKDRQHRWVLLNDSFCEAMGFCREDMLGKSNYDFFAKDEADNFWAEDELVFSTGHETVSEGSFTDVHGKEHTIIIKKALYVSEDKEQFIVGIIRDITERISLESQLRQATKMEAVGTLAGGIAHDFNNLLTAIIGYCDLLLLRMGENNEVRPEIERIKKAGESAASLTSQLLAFSRKQVLQPRILDLNQVIKDTKTMLQRLIGEDIVLESSLDPSLSQAFADPVLIEQVILNLSVNARDAMPAGGRLTIETANAKLDETYAQQNHDVVPGSYVMMAISDTGIGLDKETMTHIFEPFFTTKEKGKGTGLGLATVYGIVKQSQGHIAVYSEKGHGTTFKIYLPKADKQMEDIPAEKCADGPAGARGGEETILLAEDNQIVRDLACAILESKGYQVIATSCGKEALQAIQTLGELPDLLITDVVMPEMSGSELVEKISELYQDIKTLYISGYTGDAIFRHGVLDPNTEFLHKPFTAEDLAEKVRTILDGS